jgi:glycosyltransferase involved in cell wall biosynthesis
MQNKNCLISVVIPVRDRTDQLKRCIDSIKLQDFAAECFDVIVCDDGSIGDLSGILEDVRPGQPCIRLIRQNARGPAAARNLGIRESLSPVIVFLDSDIIAGRGLIRHIYSALMENPSWAGAEACLLPIEGFPNPLWEAPGAIRGGRYHTAAIAYRREALLAAGGLDEAFPLPACEDVELAARILSEGLIGFVPEAKAYHPRRKVDLRLHWRSRQHWKYLVILAERYGFLAFPEHKIRRFYRLRVAWAAVIALPLGRLLKAVLWLKHSPSSAIQAGCYALFDIMCGLWALPGILLSPVPKRMDYLRGSMGQANELARQIQGECRV